ncbi:MAG: integrase core domain-containing protein [Anaerolineales bacterium]
MISYYIILGKCLIFRLLQLIKVGVKPATLSLFAGTLSDMARSRTDLIVENALLRQQLIFLNRQVKRPQLTHRDRFLLILLARCTGFWKQALHILQPDTLLRWHRELFRFYWRRKSRHKQDKPKISPETIELIRKMAKENRLWGADRIRGELLKLDIQVCKRTIQKYLPKAGITPNPSQTWATFLKNHAKDIWACDFTVVYDWLFRAYYIFVVMELKTRRIVQVAVTQSPSDEWTAQQLREATPWGKGPKYLLHDRDSKYGIRFSSVAAGSGIAELRTPYRAPRANGVCERFMGSLRRECLDHILIHHGKHLQRVVKEYTTYFNQDRPHQGIGQHIPSFYDQPIAKTTGRITSRAILGGLHHSYSRQNNPN